MVTSKKFAACFTCSFCGYQTDIGGLEGCPGCARIDRFMASRVRHEDLRAAAPDELATDDAVPGYTFDDGCGHVGWIAECPDGMFWCGDMVGYYPTLTQASFELFKFCINN